MALRWDFRCKAGTLTQVQDGHEFTISFYEGNAFMIATYEFEENGVEKYDLMWFFVGEDHARRCLGIDKCDDGKKKNIYADQPFTSITLYRDNSRYWKKIADYFIKAFPDITVTILPHAPVSDNAQ